MHINHKNLEKPGAVSYNVSYVIQLSWFFVMKPNNYEYYSNDIYAI